MVADSERQNRCERTFPKRLGIYLVTGLDRVRTWVATFVRWERMIWTTSVVVVFTSVLLIGAVPQLPDLGHRQRQTDARVQLELRTQEFVEAQLQMADLLYEDGQFRKALSTYTKAKKTESPNQQKRASSGIVQSALRVARFDLALSEAISLRERNPDDTSVIALHGDALWSWGLFQEAEDAYSEVLLKNSKSARAHNGLARALAARGRLNEALDAAQTAVRQLPQEAELHHTVGAVFERLNRFEEAAASFANYANLLPNRHRSDKAAWARSEIRFLKSFGNRVPLEMEPELSEQLHTVPFRLIKDKVVVRARINDNAPIDLVLDTGAEKTVLSRRSAQRLGVIPVVYTLSAGVGDIGFRGLQLGRLDSLAIGSLRMNNVPCLIKSPSLGGLPSREPDGFSPLALGMSMVIDYQQQKITMARRLPTRESDIELPLRLHRLATVRGMVNGQPASFVVDTGGQVISISASTARSMSAPPEVRHIPLRVYGTSGWDKDAFLMPGVQLQFQGIHFPSFPVVVLNLRAPSALLGFRVGGIVGHDFLSKYQVRIDLVRSVVGLSSAT